MKHLSIFTTALIMLLFAGSCNLRVPGSGKVELKDISDSVSYALGYIEAKQFSNVLKQTPFDSLDVKTMARLVSKTKLNNDYVEWRESQFNVFNEAIFKKAFINELAYNYSYFNDITAEVYLGSTFERVRALKEAKKREEAIKAGPPEDESGAEFLSENAKRSEVNVSETGLQFEILKDGDGPIPQADDRVRCHYTGSLVNGEVFESSIENGSPVTLGVKQVIPGWTEALLMMPVGSKWKLYIPSNLAYGEAGAGSAIGPNETLIFELELLEIVE